VISSARDTITTIISPTITITIINMVIIISIKLQERLMVLQQQQQFNLMVVREQLEVMVAMGIIIIIRYHLHHILITTPFIRITIQRRRLRCLQKHSHLRRSSNLHSAEYKPSNKQRRQFSQDSVRVMFLKQLMFLPTVQT
jgi:uncharacterized membrane protein YciS (DUF1049 family)